jgi:hypothetical protein
MMKNRCSGIKTAGVAWGLNLEGLAIARYRNWKKRKGKWGNRDRDEADKKRTVIGVIT